MTTEPDSGAAPSFCGNCGAAMTPRSQTCAACGRPATPPPTPTDTPPPDYIPYCRNCGIGVPWGAGHTCRRCGMTPLCRLHFQAAAGLCLDCAAPPSPAASPTATYGGGLTCRACGAAPSPNAEYCPNCGRPLTAAAYVNAEYMGFWIRFAAFVVDRIITYVIAALIAAGIGISRTSGQTEAVPAESISVAFDNINYSFLLLVWGVSTTYGVLLTAMRGQTIGKMLLRIQVVDANGNIPPWHRVIAREVLGKFASEIIIWLGYIWIGFDQRKRGWHDYLGGSYVIRKPRRPEPPNAGYT